MVKRRKMLIGLGALAAGSAAGVGTGALSASEIDRDMTGRIANDTNGYVALKKGFDNGQHVSYSGGELVLDFGNLGDNGGGLNADSVNYFDSLFRVEIQDDDVGPTGEYQEGNDGPTMNEPENYWFWVTTNLPSGANVDIDFYRAGGRTNSIVGEANAQQPNDGNAGFWVGVCIDLDDSGYEGGASANWEDAFTLHVSDQKPAAAE